MLLPPSSVSTICTKKLSCPVIVWISKEKFSEEDALNNAYCIPENDEPKSAYLDLVRAQFVDRYGGHGIGFGGGSGRCATFGTIQIKGVGRTPLVALKKDRFHSNGMMSIEEVTKEIIWGEICEMALPYGAVRALGAIKTGTTFNWELPNGEETKKPRVLLYREWALRPAHYMRNLHFESKLIPEVGMIEDAVGTSLSVQTLADIFRSTFDFLTDDENQIGTINASLREMTRRFAAQVATASVKRIFHGGLTPSNIAIDGRYMDFGTITSVVNYERRAIRPLESHFLSEDRSLLNVVIELRFYVAKYFDSPNKAELISIQEIASIFGSTYRQVHKTELIKLTGIPSEIVADSPDELSSRLYKCLLKILAKGGETFVRWKGESGIGQQPRKSRRYDLNKLLVIAALATNDLERMADLANESGNDPLIDEFTSLYSMLLNSAIKVISKPSKQVRIFIAIQAIRRNADISFLIDDCLEGEIENCIASQTHIGNYIEHTISRAREILLDELDTSTIDHLDRYVESAIGPTEISSQCVNSYLLHAIPYTTKYLDSKIKEKLEKIWNSVL